MLCLLLVLAQDETAEKALQFVVSSQQKDGSWKVGPRPYSVIAATALNAMALARGGEKRREPLGRAREYLRGALEKFWAERQLYDEDVFVGNLFAGLFLRELADPDERERAALRRIRDYFERRQKSDGGWHYEAGSSVFMSALVVLVLDRAEGAAADRAREYFKNAQRDDGGFEYYGGRGRKAEVGRTAAAAIAMSRLGMDAARARGFVEKHLASFEDCHGGPAIHYFVTGLACREAGGELAARFVRLARERLAGRQARDGSILFSTARAEFYPEADYTTGVYVLGIGSLNDSAPNRPASTENRGR